MLNVTTLISKHTDRRAFDALSLRRNDLWSLSLQTADPAERTDLLFRLAEMERQLESLADRLYSYQAARWHADAAMVFTYVALSEQALYEARWTAATDLKADGVLRRDGGLRRIIAVAGGQRFNSLPTRIVIAWEGRGGEVREELDADELVQTHSMTASPPLKAVTDGAPNVEVALWEQLTQTPRRTERAAIYRKLAEVPGLDHELLENLALAEEHLAPGSPPHPHLVAAEREERRVRAAERVLLAAGLCALAITLVDEPDGPLFWLTLLSGLAATVACRFGAHEALTRRASKDPR